MKESEVLEEMIEWINNRIKELPEEKSIYYKEMKLNLKWELRTLRERNSEIKIN